MFAPTHEQVKTQVHKQVKSIVWCRVRTVATKETKTLTTEKDRNGQQVKTIWQCGIALLVRNAGCSVAQVAKVKAPAEAVAAAARTSKASGVASTFHAFGLVLVCISIFVS